MRLSLRVNVGQASWRLSYLDLIHQNVWLFREGLLMQHFWKLGKPSLQSLSFRLEFDVLIQHCDVNFPKNYRKLAPFLEKDENSMLERAKNLESLLAIFVPSSRDYFHFSLGILDFSTIKKLQTSCHIEMLSKQASTCHTFVPIQVCLLKMICKVFSTS